MVLNSKLVMERRKDVQYNNKATEIIKINYTGF